MVIVVEYFIYTYIYIVVVVVVVVVVVIRPLSISFIKPIILSNVCINSLESGEPSEPVVVSHLAVPAHQTLRGRIPQRRHVRKPHTIHCFFFSICVQLFRILLRAAVYLWFW